MYHAHSVTHTHTYTVSHTLHLHVGAIVPDVMHDVLEGILQYEAKLVLEHCITKQCYFTLDELNQNINSCELGYAEGINRPSFITSTCFNSDAHSLNQSGMCPVSLTFLLL